MSISFPTRPAHDPDWYSRPGVPHRAEACQCDHEPAVCDDGTRCFRCGRYLPLVIRRTWHERALAIAGRNQIQAAA